MTDEEIIIKYGVDNVEKYKRLVRELNKNPYPMTGEKADAFIEKYFLVKI